MFGKIIGKGGKGCWEVCLLCAPREISMIYGKDIRNFLYVGESRSATAGGATKNSNQATTTRTTRRNTRGNDPSNNSNEDDLEYDEDELIDTKTSGTKKNPKPQKSPNFIYPKS